MDSLEHFKRGYDKAVRQNRAEAIEERAERLEHHKRQLDDDYNYEQLRAELIAKRQVTLEIASDLRARLGILRQNSEPGHVQPDIEHFYDEPIIEKRGWPIKRNVEVGKRRQIAVEGWPLPSYIDHIGKDRFINNSPYKLLLTPDNNVNGHPPLVWYFSDKFHTSITKSEVLPFSKVPLSSDDMLWQRPRIEKYYPSYEYRPYLIPEAPPNTPDEPKRRLMAKADCALYKKLGIESALQSAMGKIAARYELFE